MKKFTCLLIVFILLLGTFPTAQASEYMTVYAPDGRTEWIRTADFYAWHAVGWYSAPVMYVYALDGRTQLILTSDFSKWQAVGWYSAPMMYVYNPYGKKQLIRKDEFDYFHKMDWYSAPVRYVYARDGRKQLVLESEAPAWKAVGWDYQTGYADNIPWENDSQQWAIIDLECGPYSNWQQNRNYYINKYFIEMPESDRQNIKHYSNTNDAYHHRFLFIPRFKTTNTITHVYVDFNVLRVKEGKSVWSIGNGLPFSVQFIDPPGDIHPILKIKNSRSYEFVIYQNLSDIPGLDLEDEKVLDLTEWQYYSYY